ncbi:MAG: aminotransferase class V-fold PLP-dependent enzyme [Burkholderiaceae bacterium]|jgi:isopenicillin-N epimerase|nr:aminotransferase class V-fold PLP-dependent enzyme [Burkholderiaceae bacterium]
MPPLPSPSVLRTLFLLEPGLVFLNHGSFGACPAPVFEAYQQWQRELERNPVAFLGRRSAGLLRGARERLAAFLGASADDLVFVPNATTGVNIVARSLRLSPGDEVLSTDHEYGACDATLRMVCERAGAVLRRVTLPLPFEPGEFVPRLMAAATPRTRLIFASHVTSTTALVFPVAELCARAREAGIATLIDGAHAPGQLELDLAALGADYYTGNAHKWLCAPKGAAFLHVQPGRQAALDGGVVSWGWLAEDLAAGGGGHTGFDAYVGTTLLERRLQWQGTRDIAAFLAVPAALDFLAAHDWPAHRALARARGRALQSRVCTRNGLEPIGPDATLAPQMVPLPVRTADGEGLRRWLAESRGIEVPVTQHAGRHFVRVSVQAYTTDEEIAALEAALAEAGA